MSDTDTIDPAEVLTTALRDLAAMRRISLAYVEYNDQLSAEQVQQCLQGDSDKVYERIWDVFGEQEYRAVTEYVEQLIPDEDRRDALSDEQMQELRDAIAERDESDPFGDLLRHTDDVLLRYDLGKGTGDYDVPGNSWSWDERTVHGHARAILRRLQLDPTAVAGTYKGRSETNLQRAVELVQNASYGGLLQVIWSGDIKGVVKAAIEDSGDSKPVRLIKFTDPRILVIDPMNGSGHEVTLSGTVVRLWNRERCVVDSASWGYGWDSICGLVKSAYRDSPELITLANKEASA